MASEEPPTADAWDTADWRCGLRAGSLLDVRDTLQEWHQAIVLAAHPVDDTLHIRFTKWSERWNEWLDRSSDRIAPRGAHTYVGLADAASAAGAGAGAGTAGAPGVGGGGGAHGGASLPAGAHLKVGQVLDVFDEHPRRRCWNPATVVDATDTDVKVHFKGWTERWDEWLPRTSPRIVAFGTHTSGRRSAWRYEVRTRVARAHDGRGGGAGPGGAAAAGGAAAPPAVSEAEVGLAIAAVAGALAGTAASAPAGAAGAGGGGSATSTVAAAEP